MEAILQAFARMEKREKRREQALERIGNVKSDVGTRSDIKEEPPATPDAADSPAVMQVRCGVSLLRSLSPIPILNTRLSSTANPGGQRGAGLETGQGQNLQEPKELLQEPHAHRPAAPACSHHQHLLRPGPRVPGGTRRASQQRSPRRGTACRPRAGDRLCPAPGNQPPPQQLTCAGQNPHGERQELQNEKGTLVRSGAPRAPGFRTWRLKALSLSPRQHFVSEWVGEKQQDRGAVRTPEPAPERPLRISSDPEVLATQLNALPGMVCSPQVYSTPKHYVRFSSPFLANRSPTAPGVPTGRRRSRELAETPPTTGSCKKVRDRGLSESVRAGRRLPRVDPVVLGFF